MLKHYGARLSEIELVNVNFSLSPSLMSQQVEAVTGAFRNFELNQMASEGVEGRCFYLEEEGIPLYDEIIYIAHVEKIDQNKLRRFLRASELTTQFILNYPQESWDICRNYSPELDDELNARAWENTLTRFVLRPEAPDEGRYARFEQFLADSNLIQEVCAVSDVAIGLGERQ